MADEAKAYTKGELDLLVAVAEVKTMQKVSMDNFSVHMKDDEEHFHRLYSADKQILEKIEGIPDRMTKCADQIKDDIFEIADERYTPDKEFKVFKTKVITAFLVGTTASGIIATLVNVLIQSKAVG